MPLSFRELDWFVGLFEGEGSVSSPKGGQIRLSIDSTDLDVLERVEALAGGKIYGPYQKASRKPIYCWVLQGRKSAGLTMTIFNQLASRRKSQAHRALLGWKNTTLSTDIIHGTASGYHKELRRGYSTCTPCRKAYNPSKKVMI